MSLVGIEVSLQFSDPDPGRETSTPPEGIYKARISSLYEGIGSQLCYYLITHVPVVVDRHSEKTIGTVIAISPDAPSGGEDIIGESIKTTGRAVGYATLVRRRPLPRKWTLSMLQEHEKPFSEREFVDIGSVLIKVEGSIRHH